MTSPISENDAGKNDCKWVSHVNSVGQRHDQARDRGVSFNFAWLADHIGSDRLVGQRVTVKHDDGKFYVLASGVGIAGTFDDYDAAIAYMVLG